MEVSVANPRHTPCIGRARKPTGNLSESRENVAKSRLRLENHRTPALRHAGVAEEISTSRVVSLECEFARPFVPGRANVIRDPNRFIGYLIDVSMPVARARDAERNATRLIDSTIDYQTRQNLLRRDLLDVPRERISDAPAISTPASVSTRRRLNLTVGPSRARRSSDIRRGGPLRRRRSRTGRRAPRVTAATRRRACCGDRAAGEWRGGRVGSTGSEGEQGGGGGQNWQTSKVGLWPAIAPARSRAAGRTNESSKERACPPRPFIHVQRLRGTTHVRTYIRTYGWTWSARSVLAGLPARPVLHLETRYTDSGYAEARDGSGTETGGNRWAKPRNVDPALTLTDEQSACSM